VSAKALTLARADHHKVEKVYLPLIKAMYKEANIDIKLYYVNNSPRPIKALNDGLFDADVGKILESVKDYENIIHVPTPLTTTRLYLACSKKVVCDRSILLNQYIQIASSYTAEIIKT